MKAQVSLEYLSTYSWAIVILVAILGSLSYFGFFNVQNLAETRCETGRFLECKDVRLEKDGDIGTIRFKLQNNMQDDILLTKKLFIIDEPANVECIPIWQSQTIKRGEVWDSPACNISKEYYYGDFEEMSIEIYFERLSGGPEHIITGSLTTLVEEK